jgi:hypothetical protein
MPYLVAYLDEFGHIGPFIARSEPKYNESPVFGLGGYIIPLEHVRDFGSWFFRRKSELLAWEIEQSGKHPAHFEKKGSALYTSLNVEKYPELRRFTLRFLAALPKFGASVFFVGIEKTRDLTAHNGDALYEHVLREAIKRLDQHCEAADNRFIMVLDEHPSREKILTVATTSMFGALQRTRLIEPPFQVPSHRFQTVQAADWLCGLIGRLGCCWADPTTYADCAWARRHFQERLLGASVRSGIRSLPGRSPKPDPA